MKTRTHFLVLIVLLTMSFCGHASISVLNKVVTTSNCSDILGNGTIKFDYDTRILYLKNVDVMFAQQIGAAIQVTSDEKPFDICVEGDCSIESLYTSVLELYGCNNDGKWSTTTSMAAVR